MVSRILLGKYNTINDIFRFCVEVCVYFLAYFLIRRPRRRDTSVTSDIHNDLKCTKKRLSKVTLFAYPRAYLIFTKLMWSMDSVAMLLSCALCCFGAIFRLFEYGFICLFALPRLKKPPDLVFTRLRRGVGTGRKGFIEPNVRYTPFGRLFWS